MNKTEKELQEIYRICDEYLAERKKNDSSGLPQEFLASLLGEPNYSEEDILELRLNATASEDFREQLNNQLEIRQEHKDWLAKSFLRLFSGIFGGILLSAAASYWLISPPKFDLFTLGIYSFFAVVTLVISTIFSLSAKKYKILRSRWNCTTDHF